MNCNRNGLVRDVVIITASVFASAVLVQWTRQTLTQPVHENAPFVAAFATCLTGAVACWTLTRVVALAWRSSHQFAIKPEN